MDQSQALIEETARRVLAKHCTRKVLDEAEKGVWAGALWATLHETGLTAAARSEARGGSGGDPAVALALVRAAGTYCAPVPLAETLLAEEALAAADLAPVEGPATVAPVLAGNRLVLERARGRWKLSGLAQRVPWARHAAALVLIADHGGQPVTVRIERPAAETPGSNTAREPRDDVRLDGLAVPDEAVGRPGQGLTVEALYVRGALARTVAMAGALEKTLEMTITYAKERVQFGRPIGKFQAVQQQVALMASHVAAASAAAHAAVASGGRTFEVAAAKVRAGEAAGSAAAIAHQVHGAIGFTHEHDLHRYTRRLWSWRDEFGTEAEWARWVGRAAAAMSGEALWPFLTSAARPPAGQPPVF